MAKTNSVVLLVQSLTKSEKRFFRLFSQVQKGDKNYIGLFELIEQKEFKNIGLLKEIFLQRYPDSSFEITIKYLYEVLMESLIHLKNKKDEETSVMYNTIVSVKILFEKSLYNEGFNELYKLQKLSELKKNNHISLIAYQTELIFRNQLSFQEFSETSLIQIQMKITRLLKTMNNAHQHISLYELLRHRSIYKGTTRNIKQKQELNDLVVTELGLMAHASLQNFEAHKTHLLFQSTYCITVGDYNSALKTFYELNQLFEANYNFWKDFAFDYLTCLEGILNSLRTIKHYDEINFYLDKVNQLQSPSLLFNVSKNRVLFLYTITRLLDYGHHEEALKELDSFELVLFKHMHVLGYNRQAEIYIQMALVHFCNEHMSATIQIINKVLLGSNEYYRIPEYKTFRLIRLLAHYELGNHDFVEYEITAIKRQLNNKEKTYQLEKLIFKFIQNKFLPYQLSEREILWKKLQKTFQQLEQDKYEIQILKIFNFSVWVESKLYKKSFHKLLKERAKT